MRVEFRLFGWVHLAILAAVPLVAGLAARYTRRHPRRARAVRLILGTVMAANVAAWYLHEIATGAVRFPGSLPLQLCDFATWFGIAAVFTLRPALFELAYYTGIAGSGMALLTPDLWAPLCAYPSIEFFVEHGLTVTAALYLVWSRQARPRPGSAWRTWILLHGYAAAIGTFNAVFHTNYFYICRKPEQFSVLNWFGPWPWYILAGDALALALLWLLGLPFKPRGSAAPRSSRSPAP